MIRKILASASLCLCSQLASAEPAWFEVSVDQVGISDAYSIQLTDLGDPAVFTQKWFKARRNSEQIMFDLAKDALMNGRVLVVYVEPFATNFAEIEKMFLK